MSLFVIQEVKNREDFIYVGLPPEETVHLRNLRQPLTACVRRSVDIPATGTRKYPGYWPVVTGLLYCAFLARQGQAA